MGKTDGPLDPARVKVLVDTITDTIANIRYDLSAIESAIDLLGRYGDEALAELDLEEIEGDLLDAHIHTLHMPHHAADGVARWRL